MFLFVLREIKKKHEKLLQEIKQKQRIYHFLTFPTPFHPFLNNTISRMKA